MDYPTFHGLSDGAKSVMHSIHTLELKKKMFWGGKGGGDDLGVPVVKFYNNGFSGRRSWREAEWEL